MIYLKCPKCGARRQSEGFRVRAQFCLCGWWRDRPPEGTKKPYRSPVITEYGTLSDITGSSANAGMLDGDPFGLKTSGRV